MGRRGVQRQRDRGPAVEGWAARLFGRIVAEAPDARTVLLTSARERTACDRAAAALAGSASATGARVAVLSTGRRSSAPEQLQGYDLLELGGVDLSDGDALSGLTQPYRYALFVAPGLLDRPEPLLLARAADASILLAQCGSTTRADLGEARADLSRVHSRLLAALLLR